MGLSHSAVSILWKAATNSGKGVGYIALGRKAGKQTGAGKRQQEPVVSTNSKKEETSEEACLPVQGCRQTSQGLLERPCRSFDAAQNS